MLPIVCFVGASDCGKTTLIENIIPILNKKGFKVATVKNDIHGFDVDREGKDTYRHKKAGAHSVIISGPDTFAMISEGNAQMNLDDYLFLISSKVDIVLTEGFKSSKKPKIELFLKGVSSEIMCSNDPHLVAVATNDPESVKSLTERPVIDLNNYDEIAEFIQKHFILPRKRKVFLMVNGKKIKIKDFVEDIISSTVRGMMSELKDCDNPKSIKLIIDEK